MVAISQSPLWITNSSKVYVQAAIAADETNLAGLPVEMQLIKADVDRTPPNSAEWKTAQWLNNRARILVGPGTDVELNPGTEYDVWARITAGVEVPEIYCGRVITF